MESQNNLDINGDLRINSLAELFAEIAQNKLNGSLRMTNEAQKIAVYFDAGEAVFTVSNARAHRLYEMLLQAGKITKEQLAAIPDFTNDLGLKEKLLVSKTLEKEALNQFLSHQMRAILETALAWRIGAWTFSPLVRIKGDMRIFAEIPNLLIEHARSLSAEEAARKLVNPHESFSAKSVPAAINLSPPESFVFSRFETSAMEIKTIETLSGLPAAQTRRILYALWIGGLLVRENWSAAFTERKIAAILSARLTLKKEEQPPPAAPPQKAKTETAPQVETKIEAATEEVVNEEQISLENYLERVEEASNFYEIFALAPDTNVVEIKQIYFSLAKRFHPDLYHRDADAKLLRRIQTAFTELAHAYETLKTDSSREVYDFRMRKELANLKALQAHETTVEAIDEQKLVVQATENFEQGLSFLMDGNHSAAVPFLARAVHYNQHNARYHAFYGKALAADDQQRHKAEGEMRIAVKLDGENADYQIMLAEFYVQFNLLKRAEGELNRLLTIHPNNAEARRLLDSLPKK